VADRTVALVREHGLAARAMIQSFDWRVVRRVQAIAPEIPTGCLTAPQTVARTAVGPSPFNAGLDLEAFGGSVPRLAHAAGCRYWTPAFRMIGAGDVAEAHRLGLRVVPWTVNEPEDLRSVVALGVDGLITDYPDRIGRRSISGSRDSG
jgi:glycerophosphoryl diester phosphodiesterase